MEREQKLKNSMEETKNEITTIEVTIQKLNELKDKAVNSISIINQELDKPIEKLNAQKEFLQDIFENDKAVLFGLISDEERHQAINNKICVVCGNKLNWSCYAEDSFSIECVNCDVMYAEH